MNITSSIAILILHDVSNHSQWYFLTTLFGIHKLRDSTAQTAGVGFTCPMLHELVLGSRHQTISSWPTFKDKAFISQQTISMRRIKSSVTSTGLVCHISTVLHL